jgi:hypothetical protein
MLAAVVPGIYWRQRCWRFADISGGDGCYKGIIPVMTLPTSAMAVDQCTLIIDVVVILPALLRKRSTSRAAPMGHFPHFMGRSLVYR